MLFTKRIHVTQHYQQIQ